MENKIRKYQLVTPHIHREKIAEQPIKIFKKHFKSSIAYCDPDLPLSEWYRLINQDSLTLNLLRDSQVTPKISAHTYLFGEFNFNITPLALPGTKVISHHKPDHRASWGPQGIE